MSLSYLKTLSAIVFGFLVATTASGALVDTNGAAVTNETALGDIDMAASTYGDLKNGIAPDYSAVSNAAIKSYTSITNGSITNIFVTVADVIAVANSTNDFERIDRMTADVSAIVTNAATSWRIDFYTEGGTYFISYTIDDYVYNREGGLNGEGYVTFKCAGRDYLVEDVRAEHYDEETYLYFLLDIQLPNGWEIQSDGSGEVNAVSPGQWDMLLLDIGDEVYYYGDDNPPQQIGSRNLLGLAMLSDIPTNNLQLANGAGYVTASITNGLAITSITNGLATLTEMSSATNQLSTDLKFFVTNTVVVGYTDWVYTGDTSSSATYSISMTEHQGGGGLYDFTLYDPIQVGVVTTNELNPTVLVYVFDSNTKTITATREEIRRDANGRALYSDVQRLKTYVDDMDTSYQRFDGITNKNQSVQYICTDANTTTLEILMPDSGITKDWLVYILPTTNLNIVLPPANYWVSNESVTNAVPADTPTALYFTQIDNNTFSIGRKEFVPITVLSAREKAVERAKAKSRKRGLKK